MKNTFGNSLTFSLFGESHGDKMGLILDGLSPGMKIDPSFIRKRIFLRSAHNELSTSRQEKDDFKIVSGALKKDDFYISTGSPLCILIENREGRSRDYQEIQDLLRPGHADFTAYAKYKGFQDKAGGGHFSGRLTAPLVAGGAILLEALRKKGIRVISHILKLGNNRDFSFMDSYDSMSDAKIEEIFWSDFPLLNRAIEKSCIEDIKKIKERKDSLGGLIESMVIGLPAGLGDPFFDTVEGLLSHAIFSIPAVKGISFGAGFDFADMPGSLANDSPFLDNGQIRFKTNNNGGVNGGISNGMPLIYTSVIKPTPSIGIRQDSVNLSKRENDQIEIKGRHDPCILPRALEVINCVSALCLADMLLTAKGPYFFTEEDVKWPASL